MTTRDIARAFAWLLLAAAFFLTLAPPAYRPPTGVERHFEHFLAFALVGVMFAIGYPRRGIAMAIAGVAIAAALETLQLWVPGRHAYLSDFVMNGAGIWAGLAAGAMLQWIAGPQKS